MKDKVKDMFAQVTMPEATEQKIRSAVAAGQRPKRSSTVSFAAKTVTTAAVLALVLSLSPVVRAAVSEWVVKYIFPESGITVYEETEADGGKVNIMAIDTEAPAFAHVEDGRLYFTGNGENIDITDQITEEEPFLYTYVDEEYGLIHYMAVGYSGSIENFGIYEFLRENEEGQEPWEGWANGYGRNFLDPDTNSRYPWVDAVWEALDVPWPMPES